MSNFTSCQTLHVGRQDEGWLLVLLVKFVLPSSFSFIQMNVALAFIFLIQEVVTPIIILSCFPLRHFCKLGLCVSSVMLILHMLCVCFLETI